MLFTVAVTRYLQYLSDERRRVENTVRQYRWALNVLRGYLCETAPDDGDLLLEVLTPEAMSAFYSHVCTRRVGQLHYSRNSVDTLWCAMVGLRKWAVRQSLLEPCVIPEIDRLPKAPRKKEFVSDSEVAMLFRAVETLPERQRDLHRAVLYLWCNLGLRCCEILKLQLDDLYLGEPAVVIRQTKGNKSRRLAPSDECAEALRRWIASRPETIPWPRRGTTRPATQNVFCQDPVRPLGYAGLSACLKRIKLAAGFTGNERIKPHRLRHWCATYLHRSEKGWTLEDLREFLGHSSIAITAIYLHTGEERLHTLRNTQSIASLCAPAPAPEIASLPPASAPIRSMSIPARPEYDYDPASGLMRIYAADGTIAASFVLDKGLPNLPPTSDAPGATTPVDHLHKPRRRMRPQRR